VECTSEQQLAHLQERTKGLRLEALIAQFHENVSCARKPSTSELCMQLTRSVSSRERNSL
jgi:hypothetical protein